MLQQKNLILICKRTLLYYLTQDEEDFQDLPLPNYLTR